MEGSVLNAGFALGMLTFSLDIEAKVRSLMAAWTLLSGGMPPVLRRPSVIAAECSGWWSILVKVGPTRWLAGPVAWKVD
jgi:hypothetical protein